MTCPASVVLSEGIVQPESPYAKEGTAAHELAEMSLIQGEEPHWFIGSEINGVDVTEEMADAVKVYTDYIKSFKDLDVMLEERFTLDVDERCFGTGDCTVIDPFTKVSVIDYKHGKGHVVNPEENPQLLYYALGAIKDVEAPLIDLTIVQPRAGEPAIRTWSTTLERVEQFEGELKEAISLVDKAAKAKDPYKYAKAGDHCTFCPAAGTCKTLRERSMDIAKAEFDDVGTIALPEPTALTEDEVVNVLSHAKMIEAWIKKVEQHAKAVADSGQKVKGYKLVQKRANRKWKDEAAMIAEFDDLFGDELYEKPKLLTPAKLEKIVGKEAVAKFTYKPETGTVLVPESDKRKEVQPSAIADFTNID
jgi:hypothetical protein